MPYVLDCEIAANDEAAPAHRRMRVCAPQIAREAQPGQFAMLQTADGYAPFLRRPMSFERVLPEAVAFLYKVEGEGTRLLAAMRPGQTISVHGPLGKGFSIDSTISRHILVAGGIGVAPLPALADAVTRACRRPPDVVIGARTKRFLLCGDVFRSMGCEVYLATDDGSVGEKGVASHVLERLAPNPDTQIYACGPMPMMRATAQIAARSGAACQVSLEAQMACGDGACLGCVVESIFENEGEKMVRVCTDGPVFDAQHIDWNAHNFAYDR
ncbi:MAG TPA: dihydroorotate dehydrogenase electron transfer subunit [Candidatus Hydrogenedentes bacterium]|nr:dihydroorotate dehydrogenase electron transfer subunit [Candidatus Hydrogenedentota bacterium]